MKIIIYAVGLIILVSIGYFVYSSLLNKPSNQPPPAASVNSFEDCVNAGYSVMESYPRKCQTPDGKTFTENIPNSPDIISGIKSIPYENKEFGFEMWYPEGSSIENENFDGYLKATSSGTTAFAVFLGSGLFSGTNLTEAAVLVGVSPEENAVKKCGNPQDSSEAARAAASIGGNSFNVFTSYGAAAGNIYDSKLYRIVHNGSCYEIVELLHSGNIGNYPSGTVTEFDKNKFSDILEKIVQTFTFTQSAGSGVIGKVSLGPVCPVEKRPPDPSCAMQPYQTSISITKEGFSQQIESDFSGRFKVDLDAGSYKLKVGSTAAYPKCEEKNAEVKINSFLYLEITCDTGIR